MEEEQKEPMEEPTTQEEVPEELPATVEGGEPPSLMGSGGIDVDGALQFWQDYLQLTDDLLDDADYQTTSQGKFKKKSAWRKYATAFNISVDMLDEDVKYNDDWQVILAKYRVKATLPNQRFSTGVGACSSWERGHENDKTTSGGVVICKGPCNGRKHFSHADHDILGTAFTRAVNRAISDLIGAGEVSAEELALRDESEDSSESKSTNRSRGGGRRRGGRTRTRNDASEDDETEETSTEQPPAEKVEEDVSTDWEAESKKEGQRFVDFILTGLQESQLSVNNRSVLDAGEYYLKHGEIKQEEFDLLKEIAGRPAE